MPLVQSLQDSGLLLLTLANSACGNRLNPSVLGALKNQLEAAANDEKVRAVLLRSNGKIFSQGMDLLALKETNWELQAIKESVKLYTEVLKSIYYLDKPVVGLLQGEVKAGGVGLIAACDYIIGTEEANFEMAEVFFGLVPANVLPVLQCFRLRPATARALVLSARKVLAVEAKELGLLDELVQTTELEKRLKDFFKRLMCFSPLALKTAKKLTAELSQFKLENLFQRTAEILVELLSSKEVQEGIETFLEGGSLPWSSRFKPSLPLAFQEEEK